MLCIWLWMIYSALETIELFLEHPKEKTLPQLAQKLLGPVGKWLSIVSFVGLHYSLLAAYTAGSSDILSLWLPRELSYFLFIASSAILISTAYKSVDIVNRFLFFTKILTFAVLVFYLLPQTGIPTLEKVKLDTVSGSLISIFFTSFGFHGSIPVLINYIGHDRKQLQRVFIIGSLIPLFVYIIWMWIVFGGLASIPNTLDALIQELSRINWLCKILVNCFSLLAILTSFLGVAMALFDLNYHALNKRKLFTTLTTFIPPLLFVMFYPAGFVFALRYAAAALATFAIILPFSMQWIKTRSVASTLLILSGLFIVFCG